MPILGTYLMPHPPIILPEVGQGQERRIQDTINSLNAIGKDIKEKSPSTIVIITPHGTMFNDAISMVNESSIEGDLSMFGVPEVSMKCLINQKLTGEIETLSNDENVPVVLSSKDFLETFDVKLSLDHGTLVPLYYVNKFYSDYRIVHITYAPLNDLELYQFGTIITKAIEALNENAIVIASGDLSHKLKDDGPYDYSPYGKTFDTTFVELLEKNQVRDIFSMDSKLISEAGECGFRSVLIMLGVLDGYKVQSKRHSYEGPFGVGYGVMSFSIVGKEDSKLGAIEQAISNKKEQKLNNANPYVKLARESLTTYLETGKELKELPSYVTDEMEKEKRGVFVSLKKNGELRGCIGTILPTTNSIAEEIIRNAVEAGLHDPRFYEVNKDELLDIDFSVDVLGQAEPATTDQLDPKNYGVIVYNARKKGLLLPNLEGIDTVEEQLSIVLQKAGIEQDEPYELKRFEVIRHSEI
ncbi:hypothetical protein EDC18_103217 [Natranaerovirga pectinivora]|uniref:AMMECR1 domain-containing protein n=1 Tax=Natranaerovirga pectinivora TaxID=682400 RepID=A0A4R3MLE3_9FIRM|nr:AmmeMemoRadiSam system protein A [Natranaerovirga pectinivora]TCT15512.1 hypothetical protein EDC18_103217 [Natranaerovirga pectinivora]